MSYEQQKHQIDAQHDLQARMNQDLANAVIGYLQAQNEYENAKHKAINLLNNGGFFLDTMQTGIDIQNLWLKQENLRQKIGTIAKAIASSK
jgi:hypothetical protein